MLMDSMGIDADKYYGNNNKAAGSRLRKKMQDVKNLAQAISFEVGNLMK